MRLVLKAKQNVVSVAKKKKQEMCNEKCDDFDAYEYAEECERYKTELDPEGSSL